MSHLHVDMLGGASGDMFIAAVVDAFPHLESRVRKCVRILKLPDISVRFEGWSDELHKGRKFIVRSSRPEHHPHRTFATIKREIKRSALSAETKLIATEIFTILADAEGKVHQVEPHAVTFHEIGAWDSIMDIVSAAELIAALPEYTWSIGRVPLGSGRVRTAHGIMPVPAPATLELMSGFDVIDDGVAGERVTPTGMAILRYLKHHRPAARAQGLFVRRGIGFGNTNFAGLSNVLRILVLAGPTRAGGPRRETVSEISFDIDDQTPEDLAVALDHIRDVPGVLSVLKIPALGKKGRMVMQVQILADPRHADAIVAECLNETSTLGLRVGTVERVIVPRETKRVGLDARQVNVKMALRPDGSVTAKAESDDLAPIKGRTIRSEVRVKVEARGLKTRRKRA